MGAQTSTCFLITLDASPLPCSRRFLNIRLDSIKVLDETRHPHMVSLALQSVGSLKAVHISSLAQMAVKNCFIRGSVVRYVQLPAEHVDTQLLEDATRRGERILFYVNRVPLNLYPAQRPPTKRSADKREIEHRFITKMAPVMHTIQLIKGTLCSKSRWEAGRRHIIHRIT